MSFKLIIVVLTILMLIFFKRKKATDECNDVLRTGIIFQQTSEILFVEMFVMVEVVLLSFPNYSFDLKAEIAELLSKLGDKSRTPSEFCPIDFSLLFNTTDDAFNVKWLWAKISEVTLV